MSELLREIEEDIRRERMDKLWAKFGRVIVGASVAVVVATAVYVFWQDRKEAKAYLQTATLVHGIELVDRRDYTGAIATFNELADGGHSPYYGIAMLHKGQAQAAAGDKAGADTTFTELAGHDTVFGSLALMQTPYSAQRPAQPDKNSPLYFTQEEWRGWGLLQEGKKPEAEKIFLALRDSADAPYSLRRRMQEAVQAMGDSATMKEGKKP